MARQPADKIYFVNKGLVVMTWRDLENIPVGLYERGTWFGDIEVHKNKRRLFSCIAKTEVELFVMEKRQFKHIFFKKFRGFGRYLVETINQNFENLAKIMEFIIKNVYCDSVDEYIRAQFESVRSEVNKISRLSKNKAMAKLRTHIMTQLSKKNTKKFPIDSKANDERENASIKAMVQSEEELKSIVTNENRLSLSRKFINKTFFQNQKSY